MVENIKLLKWFQKRNIDKNCFEIAEKLIEKLINKTDTILYHKTRISFKKGNNAVVILFPKKNSLVIHLQISFYENLLEYSHIKSIFNEQPFNRNSRFLQVTLSPSRTLNLEYFEFIKFGF